MIIKKNRLLIFSNFETDAVYVYICMNVMYHFVCLYFCVTDFYVTDFNFHFASVAELIFSRNFYYKKLKTINNNGKPIKLNGHVTLLK